MSDPTARKIETWEALVAAMQIGSAIFAAATAPDGTTVRCRIAHKSRTIPATGPQHFTNAGTWITAFWLATVCREQDRMTQLSNVPIDLLRSSGAQFDEYIYHWIDALQTYWNKRPGLGDKLAVAFRASHPDEARIAPPDMLLNILSAPIDIFYMFIRREADQLNTSLADALRLHRQYWTANAERASDLDGVIALGPLAIACLAADAGFSISVESDYMPKYLLSRDWIGEFET